MPYHCKYAIKIIILLLSLAAVAVSVTGCASKVTSPLQSSQSTEEIANDNETVEEETVSDNETVEEETPTNNEESEEEEATENVNPFGLSSLEILEHEHGSFLSGDVILTISGNTTQVVVTRDIDGSLTLLGSYDVSTNREARIPHDDISKGSKDFDFELLVGDGDSEVRSSTHTYVRVAASDHKQKAMYALSTFDPGLSVQNTFDYQLHVTWDSIQELRDYHTRAIYLAAPTRFDDGPWGYMGPQVYHNENHDKVLFSFWDAEDKGVISVPYTDGDYDGSCNRNCQDGFCGDSDNGTKCTLSYEMEEDVEYLFRMHQRIEDTTITTTDAYDDSIDGVTYSGSVWQVSVTDTRSDDTQIVGEILFTNMTSGIKSVNRFHEHIGAAPCKAFYVKVSTELHILDTDSELVGVDATVNGNANSTCENYNAYADDNNRIIFETGPGVEHPDEYGRSGSYPLF